jgi:uncharacterized protein YkwD
MNAGGVLGLAAAAAFFVGCGSPSDPEKVSASEATASDKSASASIDAGDHPLSVPTDDPGTLTFETEVLRLVNDYRVSRGLNALVDSAALRDSARAHSRHMVLHRFFSHTSPEGLEPGDRLTRNGIGWTSVGENVATGYATPQAVFEAWLASPGHRANIESDRWTHAGVGYALDGAPTAEFPQVHYWTQNFLRP